MELKRGSHYDGFKSNSEKDIKTVFQIDYYFTDEKSRKNLAVLQ